MGSALWAGISGLNASSKSLDVIANNLANVNTLGFKSGTTYFSDVLSSSLSGGASGTLQVGRGVAVSAVQTQFGAGAFETTGNATDVAIDGDGFFMVNDSEGATFYTRAGAFHLDANGLLVDTNGYKVQGRAVEGGVPVGALGDINLTASKSQPTVSTLFSIGANLNSGTVRGGQYSTTQTLYDSLGAKRTLNTTFTRTERSGAGYWGVNSTLDSTAATAISANGLIFDTDGTCTGIYTGTASAVTSEHNTISATTVTTTGTGTATSTLDIPARITTDGTVTLTKVGASPATTWTVASVAYPSVAIVGTPTTTTVNIDLNADGVTDLHVNPSATGWVNADTIALTLDNAAAAKTATLALDRPGMIYQSTTGQLKLTQGATAWQVEGTGGYSNATVTSAGTAGPITLSLDGSGTTDITMTLTNTWVTGDTAIFTLTHTASALNDITVNYSGLTLDGGATIGVSGDLTWNLLGDGALNITQYSTASVIRALTADGYSSGNLKSLSISANGRINGFFTNGQTADLAQVMLAAFPNPWGLKKMGSNLFGETVLSGATVQNYPGESGMGVLTPNTLEMSNTDIAVEFIKMITAQKAYQANARVVTTQDQIMQELMNIKR
ncbi:MAG: hypothetical protein CVU52_01960 [Deltaproteobacteria bacterium HGW-Deltaproteobacteria-10]|nr:MAG: hypothetical protein CVU52_01960 [Deltaproteobacteria bacterium HGW-Deltaproteobacteria-10]